jgi:two-component system sensor histidine kinase/response regulator
MRKKRILIIDNESIALASARRTLQEDGYEVFSHSKGYSATEMARQLEPDLILLDVRRPDRTGEKLFAVLRANESTRHIPVVFWSDNHDDVRASAKRFGARGYVLKGSAALLRHCVARVVGAETPPPEYETSPPTGEGDGTY